MELTQLQGRVLLAAGGGAGRIIFWVLGDGRWILPAFSEDVAGTIRALEGAGLLVSVDTAGNPGRPPQTRAVGSHVMALTDAGRAAVRNLVA